MVKENMSKEAKEEESKSGVEISSARIILNRLSSPSVCGKIVDVFCSTSERRVLGILWSVLCVRLLCLVVFVLFSGVNVVCEAGVL